MFLYTALYVALAAFSIGLAYRVSAWFRHSIGSHAREIPVAKRVSAALGGVLLTLLSKKAFTLLRVFFVDVVLQARILKEDFLRWFIHLCIFGGFTLLFLMHALDQLIAARLFSDYYSTVNPFLFLRNLSGALVMLGVAMALYRRFLMKGRRVVTSAMDHYVLAILAVIMISGFLLEGVKIVSYSRYEGMVDEYAGPADEQELASLEAYWAEAFGVVSPNLEGLRDTVALGEGKTLHEMSCAECHSRPQWAFISYGVSRTLRPVAQGLDRAHMSTLLWYIHFLACFIGLAYLPFSKMFHIFASPMSLLVNAVMEKGRAHEANVATRQVMELDACTHCGICNLRCAVSVAFEEIPNVTILPSEKIGIIKTLARGKPLTDEEIKTVQEGIYLCTNCNRCTVACPAGINLQELWFNVREALLQEGYPEVLVLSSFSFYRGVNRDAMLRNEYREPVARAREALASLCDSPGMKDKTVPIRPSRNGLLKGLSQSPQASTFSACFACQTCTLACPVVFNYEDPQEALGLMPHQIMRAAAMGLTDMIFSSHMLWDCLACYQCQEHCPQGVCVTDVFYELKNLACEYVTKKAPQSGGEKQ
ncbi:MAG: 4Fe-4S dicluster domain-containing protein [Thermodesulfobacteriota bacterium]|nr:4Fe-4S dicluster domain-containing protein [Thermodesulfobacteriota bacterium]